MDAVPKYEDVHKPVCGFFTSGLYHSSTLSLKTIGKVSGVTVQNKHDLKDMNGVGMSSLSVSGVCPLSKTQISLGWNTAKKASVSMSRSEVGISGLKWKANTGIEVKDGSIVPESAGIGLEYARWGRTMVVASECKEGKNGVLRALDLALYSDKCSLAVGFTSEGKSQSGVVQMVSSPWDGLKVGARVGFPAMAITSPEYDASICYTKGGTTVSSSVKQNCSMAGLGVKQVVNARWTAAVRGIHRFRPKEGEQEWEGALALEHLCPTGNKAKLTLTNGFVGALGLSCSAAPGLEIGTGCEYNFKKRSDFKWGVSISLKE